MSIAARYECSNCGRKLEEGDFMAVIGTAPLGRADAILDKIGEIYCESCFQAYCEQQERS